MQAAVENGHVPARRIQIDMVGLNPGAVFYLHNAHLRVLIHQRCHNAFVFRTQVLDDHKRHAAVGRHDGKKIVEGFQAPG